jgi:hypothetical protein
MAGRPPTPGRQWQACRPLRSTQAGRQPQAANGRQAANPRPQGRQAGTAQHAGMQAAPGRQWQAGRPRRSTQAGRQPQAGKAGRRAAANPRPARQAGGPLPPGRKAGRPCAANRRATAATLASTWACCGQGAGKQSQPLAAVQGLQRRYPTACGRAGGGPLLASIRQVARALAGPARHASRICQRQAHLLLQRGGRSHNPLVQGPLRKLRVAAQGASGLLYSLQALHLIQVRLTRPHRSSRPLYGPLWRLRRCLAGHAFLLSPPTGTAQGTKQQGAPTGRHGARHHWAHQAGCSRRCISQPPRAAMGTG